MFEINGVFQFTASDEADQPVFFGDSGFVAFQFTASDEADPV